MATIGDPGLPTRYKPNQPAEADVKAFNTDEAKGLFVPWWYSGPRLLAALLWLSFVATVFLIMLRAVTPDVISGSAAAMFLVLATLVTFSIGGSK